MAAEQTRHAVVAGRFYPATAAAIRRQIDGFLVRRPKPAECIGCMLPHAGYIYSGAVAAQTLSRCRIKKTVILLGPNHTGMGTPFSIMASGSWQTPLGCVAVNRELAQAMLAESPYLQEDSLAHRNEHSLEVQLPLLQYLGAGFDIVPVCISSDDLKALEDVGRATSRAVQRLKIQSDVLVVASSDMTHYQPQEVARAQDKLAIDRVLSLDVRGLFETVHRHDISMCGYMPTVVMLACVKELGAGKAELVAYATSGDVTGDRGEVVGYAGVIIH